MEINTRAKKLHEESIVIDFHCDTLKEVVDWPRIRGSLTTRRKLGERSSEGHLDLPRLKEGGVTCQIFAVFTAREPRPQDAAMLLIDAFYRDLEANQKTMIHALRSEDIQRAKRENKIAGLLSIEGGEPLLGNLAALRNFYRLGVRAMGLTWSTRNELGNGSGEQKPTGGLTDFGVSALKEMEKLKMIIDVSHLNDQGFWDLVDYYKGTFIASHSNSRVLCKNPRNLTDEMIKVIAERDGVIGVNFLPYFILNREEITAGKKVTVETLTDHIDYINNLVGSDHLGLGSDFDGIPTTPEGLEDASKLPNITVELVKRGYSDSDISKILGGNFLRVIEKVLG